ncbi:hypothetical protein DH2020_048525 [Rehmannia glutinosa]|uniref:Uncharacterized protein n=1 Tax=Rehmannia glutinosa TaxID=99300 RepID=A0ABR0U620_REHGL
MGFEEDDRHEPNSTPKLTLSKLPYTKPREPPPHTMQTPPLRPSLSIPFRWEEAPGKPRATAYGGATPPSSANKAARSCLDLPPRLLMFRDDAKITVMPSPNTVLDGPYVGRSLSLACTFSFRKGPVVGRKEGLKPTKRRWGASGMRESLLGAVWTFRVHWERFLRERRIEMASPLADMDDNFDPAHVYPPQPAPFGSRVTNAIQVGFRPTGPISGYLTHKAQ